MEDRKSYEPLPTQRSCSYKVRLEDIGRCLRCECIVTDVFGRSTEPVYAETAPILPGFFLYGGCKLTHELLSYSISGIWSFFSLSPFLEKYCKVVRLVLSNMIYELNTVGLEKAELLGFLS